MQNFILLKIRKYEGLWKFCSDGQERIEWLRKSFSKILYKYNRLSIFNVELFLVKLKLCSNNMSEQTFWKLPKFLVYWGTKKNIILLYLIYQGDQGPWCILRSDCAQIVMYFFVHCLLLIWTHSYSIFHFGRKN